MSRESFGWVIPGPILGGELLKTGLEPRLVVSTLVGPALVCVLASLTLAQVLAGGPPRRPSSSLGAPT